MTILFAASEVAPLASTGGLGDVIASLPAYVSNLGHDVAVALPGYPSLLEGATPIDVEFSIPLGDTTHTASVYERLSPNGTQWLIIRCDSFFSRHGLYGDAQSPYPDNAARFVFFSKAVVELARRLQPCPDVIHLNDWHTALVPLIIRDQNLPLKTLLTLHNVQHQGAFWALDFPLTNLSPGWFNPGGLEFYGKINLLKGGILTADALTTVSSNYKTNILTSEGGFGLEKVLQSRQADLFAVPNGVDPDIWNPASNTLPAPFTATDRNGKAACKAALLKELGLKPTPSGPLYVMPGRLADQKGFDLLLPLLPRLFATDSRLIIVGDGEPALRRDLLAAARQHPSKMAFCNEWASDFSKRLLAGGDVLLMPSHFEPSGLTPLYGLRYGTIPVAHATGGLQENLADFDLASKKGNALLYFRDSSSALWDSIQRAHHLFQDTTRWQQLVQNAMASEFRWEEAAIRYDAIYRRLAAS